MPKTEFKRIGGTVPFSLFLHVEQLRRLDPRGSKTMQQVIERGLELYAVEVEAHQKAIDEGQDQNKSV